MTFIIVIIALLVIALAIAVLWIIDVEAARKRALRGWDDTMALCRSLQADNDEALQSNARLLRLCGEYKALLEKAHA